MSATTVVARPAPPQGRGAGQGSAGPVLRRRISKARLLLAVGLVLACALAGVIVAQRVDVRVPVLAAARAISAGQTVTAADVTTVKVAVEAGGGGGAGAAGSPGGWGGGAGAVAVRQPWWAV